MTEIAPRRPKSPSTFLTLLVRLVVLSIGTSIAAVSGIAIALWQPEWIWQPNTPKLAPEKEQFTLSSDDLFAPDKATILPAGFKLLDQVAAQLPVATNRTVRIVSHTDITATLNGKGLSLSHQRSIAVKEYLIRLRGEQNYYWIAIGYGSSRPVAVNDTEANRKTNRRIEVIVSNP